MIVNSIKTKLILFIFGLSLLSLLISGSVFYYFVYRMSTEQAHEYVANEARLIATKFKGIYNDLANNISMVSYTPPIQGIIRSKKNYDVDPIEDSTLNQWRHRLESIFMSVMKHNKSYYQMRYIGIENGGREIVRVNRENNELKVVPYSKLQQKDKTEYFEEAIHLGKGQIAYSKVNYNREHGKLDSNYISTLRVFLPIYDGNKIFGLLIINVNYPELLRDIVEGISSDNNIVVINDDGSYFSYDASEKKYSFHNPEDVQVNTPLYIKYGKDLRSSNGYFEDENYYTSYIKEKITDLNFSNNRNLTIALQVQSSKLYADSVFLQKAMLLLILFITISKLFFGYVFSLKLTNPLIKMTEAIKDYRIYSDKKISLPLDKEDEIGILARAFNTIIKNLQATVETDDLTGLYRREAFYAHVLSISRSLRRQNHFFALGVIDLNDFKRINDTFGHHKGDEVLRAVSTELKSVFRESDKIARYGGDEFVICCMLNNHNDDIQWFYEKVNRALVNANMLVKVDYKYSASAGVVIFNTSNIMTVDDIKNKLKQADSIMYEAKSKSKEFNAR